MTTAGDSAYDMVGTSNALARALNMPLEERRERWQRMMDYLLEHDVSRWCDDFLGDLAAEPQAMPASPTSQAAS